MQTRPGSQTKREEVFNACDEIVEEGGIPTTRAIINRIGGSSSTATKYLREWKVRGQAREPEAEQMIKDVYERLNINVQARVEEAERRAEEAEALAEQRQREARDAEAARDQAVSRAELARQAAEEAAKVKETATEEIAGAKAQKEAAAKAIVRAEKAEQHAREQAETLGKATERLEKAAAQAERAREAIDQRVRRITDTLKDLSDRQHTVDEGQANLAEKLVSQTRQMAQLADTIETGEENSRQAIEAFGQQVKSAVDALSRHVDQLVDKARQSWEERAKSWADELGQRIGQLESGQQHQAEQVASQLTAVTEAVEEVTKRLDGLEKRVSAGPAGEKS